MAWPVIGAGITVGAAFFVRAIDPNNGGYPLCPLKLVTGIDCPACGGLRCVHALMNGDIGAAMDQNLWAVVILPMVVVWAAISLISKWRGNESSAVTVSPGSQQSATAAYQALAVRWLITAMIVFTVVFTILRNIPGIGYLPSGIG